MCIDRDGVDCLSDSFVEFSFVFFLFCKGGGLWFVIFNIYVNESKMKVGGSYNIIKGEISININKF